ncbi:hypothetical protein AOLI_G00244200 [Acnodon oligacanthus]
MPQKMKRHQTLTDRDQSCLPLDTAAYYMPEFTAGARRVADIRCFPFVLLHTTALLYGFQPTFKENVLSLGINGRTCPLSMGQVLVIEAFWSHFFVFRPKSFSCLYLSAAHSRYKPF